MPPDPDPGTALRSARTDLTRTAILDAAQRLFAQGGYTGTSVRRLAEEAGVATRTVYLAFGSKEGVLRALADRLGEGADEAVLRALGESEHDARQLLALVARLYRNLYEHGNAVIVLLREGAPSAPVVRELLEAGLGHSRASVDELCRRLDQLGALRAGLEVDAAAGHALVLLAHDGYDELVERRGWDHDTYQAWLERALVDALLPPSGPRRKGRSR